MAIKKKWISSSWGRRNPNSTHSWEKIALETYDFNKPMVFCLGGNASVDEKETNGFCKRAETQLQLILKGRENDVDVIGCTYGHNMKIYLPNFSSELEKLEFFAKYPSSESFISQNPDRVQYEDIGRLSDEEVEAFVNSVFVPRVFENSRKLPVETGCKNLSQITFFTWCHGAREVYNILNLFIKKCLEMGYVVEDVLKMLSSMMHISYSPIVEGSLTPMVRIDSLQDYFNVDMLMDNPELNGVELQYKYSNGQPSGFFDSIHIISSKLMNADEKELNEHSVHYLDRDADWDIKLSHKNADCVSQMMSWALCRSVENSLQNFTSKKYVPKMSMLHLFDDIKELKSYFSEEELRK